jgi:hypothetical protein
MPCDAFTLDSRCVIKLDTRSPFYAHHQGGAMEKQESRIRIELTDEQMQQIKQASGQSVCALEFSAQELEPRIAPSDISFTYGGIKWTYTAQN